MSNLFLICIYLVMGPKLAPAAALKEFTEPFTIKTFIEAPGLGLEFKSLTGPEKITWKPNTRANVGVGASYAGLIGGSISSKGPLTEEDRVARGATNYQDWRFFLNYSWIQILLNYQEYYGFFIDNSSEVDPAYTNSPNKIVEPTMSARNYSANSTYVWSPDEFSLPAVLDQTVRQEESGGSLLLGLAVNHTIFNNDSYLIPARVRASFGQDQNIKTGKFTTMTVKVGYGYNWIFAFKKWYLGSVLMIGGGFQNSVYGDGVTDYGTNRSVGKGDLTLSTGYSGDKYFTGLSILGDATSFQTQSLEIVSTLYVISLFFGGHF